MPADSITLPVVETEPLADRIVATAHFVLRRLKEVSASNTPRGDEIARKFGGAAAIDKVVLSDTVNGAFAIQNSTLILGWQPILRLLDAVNKNVERYAVATKRFLLPSDIMVLQQEVFCIYLLHELRHPMQGIAQYTTVGKIKSAGDAALMAEFDTLADRDAAMGFGEIFGEDEASYLAMYQQALYFSGSFAFTAFGINSSRHDKLSRAIAVTFMAARMSAKLPTIDNADHLPLDAALTVRIAADLKSMLLMRAEPSKELLAAVDDMPDTIATLVEALDAGDFDKAITAACDILTNVGL